MDPHKENAATNSSTGGSWDIDLSMGEGNDHQLLLDHLSMEFIHAMLPIHSTAQPVLAPSSNLNWVGDHQVGNLGEQRQRGGGGGGGGRQGEEEEEEEERLGAIKEMMYKIAVMQPVDIDPATIKKPMRRNVRISNDPQSVAARHRRERISERIRMLQRLVPGGTKMDTASMLDEAIRYVKFLKKQVQELQYPQPKQSPSPPPPPPVLIGSTHQLAPAAGDWQPRVNLLPSSSSSIGVSTSPPPGSGFDSFSGDEQMHSLR